MPNLTKLVLASIFIAQTFSENYNDPKKEEPPKKEPISYKDEDLWKFCDCFEIRDELGLLDYKYDTKPEDKGPDEPVRRLANYGCGADCSKSYKEVEDCRAREDYDKKVKRDEEDKEIHEERMRHDSYHNSKYDKTEGAKRRKEDQERKDKRDREDDDERRKRDDEDYHCYGKRPDYAKDNGGDKGGYKGGDSSSSSEDKNGGYNDKDGDKNGGYSDKEYEKYPDYKDPKDPKYNEYGNEQYKDTKYYDEPKKDEKPKEEAPKYEKSGGSDSSSSSSSSSSGEKGGSKSDTAFDYANPKAGNVVNKRKKNRQLKKIYYSLDAWERYDLCYCEWSTSSTFEPKYKDYGKSGNGKNADYNKNSRMQALNDYMHTSGGATVFFSMAGVLLCILLISVGYCFYNKRTKESNIEVANLETVVKENSIEMNTVGVTDGEMIEIET